MPKSRTQHKRQLDQDLEMNGRQRRETTQQAMADGGERWHWRYSPDSGKIVFISSDQKRFSVVRDKLEKQCTAFWDTFSIPAVGETQGSRDHPIEIDETADDLALFFDSLGASPGHFAAKITDDMAGQATLLRMAGKYDATDLLAEVEKRLQNLIVWQPYKVLAFASTINDVELGRRAIRHIEFKHLSVGGGDIWSLISDLTLTWQIAFARLVMPRLSRDDFTRDSVKVKCNVDMNDIAERFDPAMDSKKGLSDGTSRQNRQEKQG